MKIVLFGANGQVGREFQVLPRSDDVTLVAIDRNRCDLGQSGQADSIIRTEQPDIVVNAAAWTAVDNAESEETAAFQVNAAAVGEMATTCAALGVPFIHISTDFVFDGHGRVAYDEQVPPAPLSAYGRSKLAGEEACMAAGGSSVILRTSWVFSIHGNNFVKTMLRLFAERPALGIVDDQEGCPTSAAGIAAAIESIIASYQQHGHVEPGIFHFAGDSHLTWHGFASAILEEAQKLAPDQYSVVLDKIGSADYPLPAPRPAWSVLDCSKIKEVYDIDANYWRRDLADVVHHLLDGKQGVSMS